MKLRIIYIFFGLALGAFLFFGNSGGRATSQGQGNTGAPGDEMVGPNLRTCQTCHNAGNFQTSLDLSITDSGGNSVAGSYNPGEIYNVKLTINATPMPTGNGGFGFQIVSLDAAKGDNGPSINSWAENAGNVQVAVASANGRQYAEHDGISASNEFEMQWTAPSAGSGNVTFYFCGNTVNGDGDETTGDNAVCGDLELTEGTASTNNLEKKVLVNIFPNPVDDVIHLKINSQTKGVYKIILYDQAGKKVLSRKLEIPSGEQLTFIKVADLPSGIYNLIMTDGTDNISKKVIKE